MSMTTEDVAFIEAPSLVTMHNTFGAHLYLPDPAVLDVAIATLVAHRLGGDPLWTLLVGAPGSGKTEVIQSVGDCPEVHPLSSLTAQTFASGLRGKARASLLHRLDAQGHSFVTLKDLTTVLTMHREARQEILAQLREIYDGAYAKEFGTGEAISWEGRLGFLAGVTPPRGESGLARGSGRSRLHPACPAGNSSPASGGSRSVDDDRGCRGD